MHMPHAFTVLSTLVRGDAVDLHWVQQEDCGAVTRRRYQGHSHAGGDSCAFTIRHERPAAARGDCAVGLVDTDSTTAGHRGSARVPSCGKPRSADTSGASRRGASPRATWPHTSDHGGIPDYDREPGVCGSRAGFVPSRAVQGAVIHGGGTCDGRCIGAGAWAPTRTTNGYERGGPATGCGTTEVLSLSSRHRERSRCVDNA